MEVFKYILSGLFIVSVLNLFAFLIYLVCTFKKAIKNKKCNVTECTACKKFHDWGLKWGIISICLVIVFGVLYFIF